MHYQHTRGMERGQAHPAVELAGVLRLTEGPVQRFVGAEDEPFQIAVVLQAVDIALGR